MARKIVSLAVISCFAGLPDDIAANPGAGHINLHTQPRSGPGVIRGQLRRF